MKTTDYILETTREAFIYTGEHRAIPRITDGLKNGQRKFLWLMRNRSEKIKVISLSGHAIAENLYLHGDASASGAISEMAAPFKNNRTLFEGVGQFGSRVSPSAIGAPRYVYVKRSKAAIDLLYHDIDDIELIDNYDGSTKEPKEFLPLIPLVLLNGISGIASGWSTEILPHSLADLKKATLQAIRGKKVEKIKPCYEYLDVDVKDLGENAWEFSGRLSIKDTSTLIVSELPPGLTLEKFRERLDKAEEKKQISSYVDRSRDKIHVEIKVHRGSTRGTEASLWVQRLGLRSRNTERIVVVDFSGKKIDQFKSPEEVVEKFVEWRFAKYELRYKRLLEEEKDAISFLEAFLSCLESEMITKLHTFESKEELEKEIRNVSGSDNDYHVSRISSLPSFKWTKSQVEEMRKEKREREGKVVEYEKVLASPERRREIYAKEVEAIRTK